WIVALQSHKSYPTIKPSLKMKVYDRAEYNLLFWKLSISSLSHKTKGHSHIYYQNLFPLLLQGYSNSTQNRVFAILPQRQKVGLVDMLGGGRPAEQEKNN
ncbi:MAG: hypothetical protein JXB30_14205, partial [Anaerolineae bacterium]|nr:hypothetical protein [Anaerolineae bacterium]